ncbi:hypothetical protein [Shimia sagamensis]|uniref:Uncharacterized protein n=1 Tax=Shimia sagamensis TaxID=1566352 RepID=A0ABY1PEL5_9RHOB|nr:hypothetical protein [Shimia sagamensis]SMP32117.1 hypothetical protein SAMN06265373_108131 [Shimia sagamensis]
MTDQQVIVVGANGVARLVARLVEQRAQEESARIAAVKARGAVPPEVGPDVIEAPARGPVRMSDQRRMVRTDGGGMVRVHDGYQGRKTLHRADAFDVIQAKARAAHTKATRKAEQAGQAVPVWCAPFSPGQVAMGRHYRDLVERWECAGVKCSSLESLSQGSSGTGGDFMDAVLADGQRVDLLRRRIGTGVALAVRRVRPTNRHKRGLILDRYLVDAVCLREKSVTDVLRASGWVKDGQSAKGEHVKALVASLGVALDRMAGPMRCPRMASAAFGGGCVPLFE